MMHQTPAHQATVGGRTMEELLDSWCVGRTDIVAIVKLARILSRESLRWRKRHIQEAPLISKRCREDASDLVTYARELRGKPCQ